MDDAVAGWSEHAGTVLELVQAQGRLHHGVLRRVGTAEDEMVIRGRRRPALAFRIMILIDFIFCARY